MKNKLTLKKETLAEITPDQLRSVAGGAAGSDSCTSCGCSCYAASCLATSITNGVTVWTERVAADFNGGGILGCWTD